MKYTTVRYLFLTTLSVSRSVYRGMMGWLVISTLESKLLWPSLRHYYNIFQGDWGKLQSKYSISRSTFDASSSRIQTRSVIAWTNLLCHISSWYTACLRSLSIGLSTPLKPTHSQFGIQSFLSLCIIDSIHRRTVFSAPFFLPVNIHYSTCVGDLMSAILLTAPYCINRNIVL